MRRALLFVLCLCAVAHAQVEVLSPTMVRERIQNPDGTETFKIQSYWNDHYYPQSGGWSPVNVNWQAEGGVWAVRNGPNQISLDSTTLIFRLQRGNHILRKRLAALAYYDPTRDSVRVLATYQPGAVTRQGHKATRQDYFPGVDVQYQLSRAGIKEFINLSVAARAALPTPVSLGLSNTQTFLVWVTELWTDSLNLSIKATEGLIDFVNARETNGPIVFKDARDSTIFSWAQMQAWVPALGGDTTINSDHITLLSRFERRRGSNYLLSGARLQTLAALPAGRIIFDPPETFLVATDQFMESKAANQNDDNRGTTTWQLGWISAPTFTAVVDTLYPTGDYAKGTWTASAGEVFNTLLDETTPNATDYIYTGTISDTAIVTMQDLAPSLDVNFHVFDSMTVAVYLRQFAGDNGYVALIADTSGDGVNNFYQFDSVLTTSSFATTVKKLFGERAITESDSLKLGVVTKWDPSTSVRVSWLVGIPYWQKVNADGDACHELITLPGALQRGNSWTDGIPLYPDSGFIRAYFDPTYTKADNNFKFRVYGLVMGNDPDVVGQADWIHRTHSSRVFKAEGAKWTTTLANETATAADVFHTFFVDSMDTISDTGWFSIRIPDTVLYMQWQNDLTGTNTGTGVVIMPDPRESGTSRRQAHSLEGAQDPYVQFFCTTRTPRLTVSNISAGDTIKGFQRYGFEMAMVNDSADHGNFDSAVVQFKYPPDTGWTPLYNYIGSDVPFKGYLDTTWTNKAIDTVGRTKPNWQIWDFGSPAAIQAQGLFPNRQGLCSLYFAAYTSWGNGDSVRVPAYVDSSFWTATPIDDIVHVDSNAATYNFGASAQLRLGKQRNLFFRAKSLPTPENAAYTKNVNIRRLLRLYKKGTSAVQPMVFRATRLDSTAWAEGDKDSAVAASGQVTWNAYKSAVSNWAKPGGDFSTGVAHDTTTMGFIGASEQYGYIDVTDDVSADSVNAGLTWLSGPRDIADFYPDDAGLDYQKPAVITVWNTILGVTSGDAAFWSDAGSVLLTKAESGGSVVNKSVTTLVSRPKIVLFWISPTSTSGPTSWSNTAGNWHSFAATCEQTSSGLLFVFFQSENLDDGDDGSTFGGNWAYSNVSAPGNGQICLLDDGFGDSLDIKLTGYTANGFNYSMRFEAFTQGNFATLSYLAIGGSDITNVGVGTGVLTRTTPTFTSTSFTIAAPAFQPDFLMTVWQNQAGASNMINTTAAQNRGYTIGVADNTNDAWYCGAHFAQQGPSATRGVFNREWDYSEFTSVDVEAEEAVRARFVAFTSTGFTFSAARDASVATGSDNAAFYYIAVKGGKWDVEWANGQNSSGGTTQVIATPDMTSTPTGVLFASAGMPDTVKEFQDNAGAIDGAADTMWCGAQVGFGAYDGTDQFAVMPSVGYYYNLAGQVPRMDMWHTTNRALVTYHNRPATAPTGVDEAITATSFAGGDINFTWNSQRGAPVVASDIGILAMGPNSSAAAPFKKKRRRVINLLGDRGNEKETPALFVLPGLEPDSASSAHRK